MSVSVIIPVYSEDQSLPYVLSQFEADHKFEIIIVDDSTDDLTRLAVESFKDKLNIKYLARHKRLGLSSAVLAGFDLASSEVLVCMDGDGSHNPKLIPKLVEAVRTCDMVFASRYMQGGSVDPHWSVSRRMISKICCQLAKPLIKVQDPMSGYFAINSKKLAEFRAKLKPMSYKIALEIAVRGNLTSINEVPLQFVERFKGKSKVNLKVVVGMIYHLSTLYCVKFLKF